MELRTVHADVGNAKLGELWRRTVDWRKRDLAVVIGLMAFYVVIMTSLALTVDRRFFINDGVSLAFWVVTGVILAIGGARASKHS